MQGQALSWVHGRRPDPGSLLFSQHTCRLGRLTKQRPPVVQAAQSQGSRDQYSWSTEPGASTAGDQGQFLTSQSPQTAQRAADSDSLSAARQQWQGDAARSAPAPAPPRPAASQQVQPQQAVQRSAAASLQNAKPALVGGGIFLAGTLLIALVRLLKKNTSPEAKRARSVNKNQFVVETLKQYLPDNRVGLDKGVVRTIRRTTGFTPEEIFRKYLWFLLRERAFDQGAVDDCVLLKGVLSIPDEQVGEALHERAQRVYDRYGNVMLEVQGMTKAGIDRKATARQLFSKLLYLSEYEQLIRSDTPAAEKADIPGVFGATEDDSNKLRIISLTEVDFDVLEAQFLPEEGGSAGGPAGNLPQR